MLRTKLSGVATGRVAVKALRAHGLKLLSEAKSRVAATMHRDEDADENDAFINENTAPGTTSSYLSINTQWARYCEERGCEPIPAAPDLLMSLMRKLIKEGKSRSTVTKSVPGAIMALHREHGLTSPTWDPRFKHMKRVAIRATPPPKRKKEVTPLMLVQMALRVTPTSFLEVRDMFLFMLMFKAMARQSEAINLRCSDIDVVVVDGRQILRVFFATHEPTKNDPERKGDCILIDESDSAVTCLVAWYRLYMGLRGKHASDYIFVSGRQGVRRLGLQLPNNRLKVRCRQAGIEPAQYSSHSLRHGGATAASVGGVLERLIKQHGRWKSDCVRVYIHDSLQIKLSVSRAMDGFMAC